MDHPTHTPAVPTNSEAWVWTPDAIALLGTTPDQAIADQFSLTYKQVYQKRTELGIQAHQFRRKNFGWSPEQLALLGTAMDSVLAKQFDVPARVVSTKRRKLNIPPFPSPFATPAVIPQHLVEQFNKLSDGEIARLTGYAAPTISKHRRKMGIATTRVQGSLPEEANALLGTVTDVELAKRYGVSTQCVNKRRLALGIDRKPPEKLALPDQAISQLGERADAAIALEFGIPEHRVSTWRRNMGLLRYGQVEWTDDVIALLGTKSDGAIAASLETNTSNVRAMRLKLGIPAFRAEQRITPEIIALFGTTSDKEIALRAGVSAATIYNYRRRLTPLN